MSITSPISVVIGGTTWSLNKINNDAYGSEYFGSGADSEVTMKIRHTREKALADGTSYDRHNVEIRETVYPTDTSPQLERHCYVVLRNKRNDDKTAVVDTWEGLVDFLTDAHLADLAAWVN